MTKRMSTTLSTVNAKDLSKADLRTAERNLRQACEMLIEVSKIGKFYLPLKDTLQAWIRSVRILKLETYRRVPGWNIGPIGTGQTLDEIWGLVQGQLNSWGIEYQGEIIQDTKNLNHMGFPITKGWSIEIKDGGSWLFDLRI